MTSSGHLLVLAKRILLGYLVLFAWAIAGMTFCLPYVTTVAVGVGLISAEGYPFPHETFQWVFGISVAVSILSGLWWYGLPGWWIGSALESIRLRLEKSASPLRQKAIGMLVLIQLCAFVLSPVTLFWWGLARILKHALGWSLGPETQIAVFGIGLLWLGLLLGRPHRRLVKVPFLGTVVLRCQMTMIDWWIHFDDPAAAERERKRFLAYPP